MAKRYVVKQIETCSACKGSGCTRCDNWGFTEQQVDLGEALKTVLQRDDVRQAVTAATKGNQR